MSLTSEDTDLTPPTDLPVDADTFWGNPNSDLSAIGQGLSASGPVIDQLGSAPFKKPDKGGFPFLGFLASVYDHVSTTAANELHAGAANTASAAAAVNPPAAANAPADSNETSDAEEAAESNDVAEPAQPANVPADSGADAPTPLMDPAP